MQPAATARYYRPERAHYDEPLCCEYCGVKVRGMDGSGTDRMHDSDCPVVIERMRRAGLSKAIGRMDGLMGELTHPRL